MSIFNFCFVKILMPTSVYHYYRIIPEWGNYNLIGLGGIEEFVLIFQMQARIVKLKISLKSREFSEDETI